MYMIREILYVTVDQITNLAKFQNSPNIKHSNGN